MKVIIIEGPDNCGKDTLINQLSNHYNTQVFHATVPKTKNLYDHYYNGIIHDTLEEYYKQDKTIIHNRSIYGEYVYGPKYRGLSKEEAFKLISNIEIGQLKTFIPADELYFILLTTTNVDLLVNNDDGKSISNKKDDISDEINSFNEIFNLSTIKNKKCIYVNDNDTFKLKDDIYNDVINFIEGAQ